MGVATVSQVTSFPRAPPQANPLQNESLGLSTLGNQRINIRVASPSLGSCCVWTKWPFVLEGKGPSPTFPPSGTGAERKGGGRFSPFSPPSLKTVYKNSNTVFSWLGGEKKRKTENPTLDPTHLTATDGDIWQEGGGAKKIPINLNSMMVTIYSTTNVCLNGKHCWAFGRGLSSEKGQL